MQPIIKKFLFLILLLGLWLTPTNLPFVLAQDFYIEINPSNPGPNTLVNARIISYSFDVDRSYITWSIDNKIALQGTGKKVFSFTTGALGIGTTLRVNITTEDGFSISKTVVLGANDVDLLWEALTYTPAGYPGKAMPTPQSLIKIVAFPHLFLNGYKLSNENLIYKWSIDYKMMPSVSGTNKNTLIFSKFDFPGDEHIIKVQVTNQNNTAVAEKRIKISSAEPKILFYQEHPLEGTRYQKALKDAITFSEEEIQVRAEPYFFSRNNIDALSYEWTIDGKKTVKKGFSNILHLRIEPGAYGIFNIALRINNLKNVLQYSEASFNINVQ